jgi:hypothetical protein
VLVAVTVTMEGKLGAESNPLAVTAPALEDHATAALKSPVPSTVALHCEVASTPAMAGAHTIATEVICGGGSTVTVALPDLLTFWVLVAVIDAMPDEDAAVKSPLALIVPALANHVTEELNAPVP